MELATQIITTIQQEEEIETEDNLIEAMRLNDFLSF